MHSPRCGLNKSSFKSLPNEQILHISLLSISLANSQLKLMGQVIRQLTQYLCQYLLARMPGEPLTCYADTYTESRKGLGCDRHAVFSRVRGELCLSPTLLLCPFAATQPSNHLYTKICKHCQAPYSPFSHSLIVQKGCEGLRWAEKSWDKLRRCECGTKWVGLAGTLWFRLHVHCTKRLQSLSCEVSCAHCIVKNSRFQFTGH